MFDAGEKRKRGDENTQNEIQIPSPDGKKPRKEEHVNSPLFFSINKLVQGLDPTLSPNDHMSPEQIDYLALSSGESTNKIELFKQNHICFPIPINKIALQLFFEVQNEQKEWLTLAGMIDMTQQTQRGKEIEIVGYRGLATVFNAYVSDEMADKPIEQSLMQLLQESTFGMLNMVKQAQPNHYKLMVNLGAEMLEADLNIDLELSHLQGKATLPTPKVDDYLCATFTATCTGLSATNVRTIASRMSSSIAMWMPLIEHLNRYFDIKDANTFCQKWGGFDEQGARISLRDSLMKKYEDAIQKKEVLPNIKIENIFGIEQIADSKTKQYPVTASGEPNHQQAVYNMFDRVFKFELTLDEYHAIQEKLFALFKEYYDFRVYSVKHELMRNMRSDYTVPRPNSVPLKLMNSFVAIAGKFLREQASTQALSAIGSGVGDSSSSSQQQASEVNLQNQFDAAEQPAV